MQDNMMHGNQLMHTNEPTRQALAASAKSLLIKLQDVKQGGGADGAEDGKVEVQGDKGRLTREVGTVQALIDDKHFGFIVRPSAERGREIDSGEMEMHSGAQHPNIFFHFSDICDVNGMPAQARSTLDARFLLSEVSLSPFLSVSLPYTSVYTKARTLLGRMRKRWCQMCVVMCVCFCVHRCMGKRAR